MSKTVSCVHEEYSKGRTSLDQESNECILSVLAIRNSWIGSGKGRDTYVQLPD
jgi:hypothetical protein